MSSILRVSMELDQAAVPRGAAPRGQVLHFPAPPVSRTVWRGVAWCLLIELVAVGFCLLAARALDIQFAHDDAVTAAIVERTGAR